MDETQLNSLVSIFYSKYCELEDVFLEGLDIVLFVESLYSSKHFESHFFAMNMKSLLSVGPKSFRAEVLTTLSIFSETLNLTDKDWCILLETISTLREPDFEEFCVIARLLQNNPVKMYVLLKGQKNVFKNLIQSSKFKFSMLLEPEVSSLSLFTNRNYNIFLLALLDFAIDKNLIPSVFDSCFLNLGVLKCLAKRSENCPDNLCANLIENFEKLPIAQSNIYDYDQLEIPELVTVIVNLLISARKLKTDAAPKNFINRIHSIILMFKPLSRIILLYKLSLRLADDDHVLGVLVGWIKECVNQAKLNGNYETSPKFILKSFGSVRDKNGTILEQFERHSYFVNFLLYLKISKQYWRFHWREQNTRRYVKRLKEVVERTKEMINRMGQSEQFDEMSLSVTNIDAGGLDELRNSEENRNRVMINISMFEVQLERLRELSS